MLHPLFPIDEANAAGMHVIPPGHMATIPVTVAPGEAHVIDIVHTAPVQDFSLRVHVSLAPGGDALGGIIEGKAAVPVVWNPRRIPNRTFAVYDETLLPPALPSAMLFPIRPGICHVNVLNLIGSENAFSLAKSVTTVIPFTGT